MRIFYALALCLMVSGVAQATLTVGNVPVTKTGGSSPVVQNSDITDTGGNVGIGSITPGKSLDVQGTARISGAITASNLSGTNTGDQDLSGLVPKTTTVNGHALSSNVTVTNSDLGSVPTTTTVNGHALSTNVTVTASDVGLGSVENTALSTWPGTTNITTVGNLTANIGIGSANPGKQLDVNGTVRATSLSVRGGASTDFLKGNGTTDSSTYLTTSSASSTYVPQTTTVNGHALSANVTVTNADLGAVPTSTTVNGHTLSSNVSVTASDVGLGSVENTALSTWAGSSNLTTVGNLTRNVGVGSANPIQALDVNGTVRATNFSGAGTSLTGTAASLTAGKATILATSRNINGTGFDGSGDITVTAAAGTLTGATLASGVTASSLTSLGTIASLAASAFTLNGIQYPTASTADNALVSDGTNVVQKGIGNCSAGTSALTYNTASHAFGCNSISGGSAAGGTNAVQYNSGSSTFAGTENKFSFNGTNVGIGTSNATNNLLDIRGDTTHIGNVGIGTNLTTTSALTVMGGNVGIGTWIPGAAIAMVGKTFISSTSQIVNGNAATVMNVASPSGSVNDVITWGPTYANSGTLRGEMGFSGGNSIMSIDSINGSLNLGSSDAANDIVINTSHNVGIGTTVPPNKMYVAGTTEMQGIRVDGNGAAAGAFLQSDANGTGTWVSPAGNVGVGTVNTGAINNVAYYSTGGITISGSTGLLTNGTNVGIGTSAFQASLAIMSGNVGIGTWAPTGKLVVKGNVGIGTATVLTNGLLTIGNQNAGSALVVCIQTNGALGKCTSLTANSGVCGTCTSITL